MKGLKLLQNCVVKYKNEKNVCPWGPCGNKKNWGPCGNFFFKTAILLFIYSTLLDNEIFRG